MSKSGDVLEAVESAILITVLGNPKPGVSLCVYVGVCL